MTLRASRLHVSLCADRADAKPPYQGVVLQFVSGRDARAAQLTRRLWRLLLRNAQNVMDAQAIGGLTVTLEIGPAACPRLRLSATPRGFLLIELIGIDKAGDAIAELASAELARLNDPDRALALSMEIGGKVEVVCSNAA
jgi:hypothetical protein